MVEIDKSSHEVDMVTENGEFPEYCDPCCGYYCNEGKDCVCPECVAFWKNRPDDGEGLKGK